MINGRGNWEDNYSVVNSNLGLLNHVSWDDPVIIEVNQRGVC